MSAADVQGQLCICHTNTCLHALWTLEGLLLVFDDYLSTYGWCCQQLPLYILSTSHSTSHASLLSCLSRTDQQDRPVSHAQHQHRVSSPKSKATKAAAKAAAAAAAAAFRHHEPNPHPPPPHVTVIKREPHMQHDADQQQEQQHQQPQQQHEQQQGQQHQQQQHVKAQLDAAQNSTTQHDAASAAQHGTTQRTQEQQGRLSGDGNQPAATARQGAQHAATQHSMAQRPHQHGKGQLQDAAAAGEEDDSFPVPMHKVPRKPRTRGPSGEGLPSPHSGAAAAAAAATAGGAPGSFDGLGWGQQQQQQQPPQGWSSAASAAAVPPGRQQQQQQQKGLRGLTLSDLVEKAAEGDPEALQVVQVSQPYHTHGLIVWTFLQGL